MEREPTLADLTSLVLPDGVASVATQSIGPVSGLFPEEVTAIQRAVVRRQREFAEGRRVARAALAKLGCDPCPIPVGPDREPVWPKGYLGSISHCSRACWAVACQAVPGRNIGIDVEETSKFQADLAPLIYSAEERWALARLPPGGDWLVLGFSAKEAFYKCFFPIARRRIGFHDVAVSLTIIGPGRGRFKIRPTNAITRLDRLTEGRGAWAINEGLVATSFAYLLGGY